MAFFRSPDGPVKAVCCEVCSIGEAMEDQGVSSQPPVRMPVLTVCTLKKNKKTKKTVCSFLFKEQGDVPITLCLEGRLRSRGEFH